MTLTSLVIDDPDTAASETVVVDCSTNRIYIDDGTTLTESNNLITSGGFPVFDPSDRIGALWPTIEATVAGVAIYRRSYQ